MSTKLPRIPHRWNLSPREAVAVQRRLAGRVEVREPGTPIRFVAGLDAAFGDGGRTCIAAAVVWDSREGVMVEERVVRRPVRFPYVPGLLSFREAPALLEALRRLGARPDALLCDGHGLAHPRRFGIACHLGVLCGWPAAGCAKSVLVGDYDEPGPARGSVTPLCWHGETVGEVIRTRDGVRPVFASVGHLMDPATVRRLVLECARGCRLPEPTRLADRRVARAKREGGG